MYQRHELSEKIMRLTEKKAFCQKTLMSAATAFRLGMEGQAGKDLVGFIDSFFPILQNFNQTGFQEINGLLNEILAAQSRKDYLRAADLLEYELSSLIFDGKGKRRI